MCRPSRRQCCKGCLEIDFEWSFNKNPPGILPERARDGCEHRDDVDKRLEQPCAKAVGMIPERKTTDTLKTYDRRICCVPGICCALHIQRLVDTSENEALVDELKRHAGIYARGTEEARQDERDEKKIIKDARCALTHGRKWHRDCCKYSDPAAPLLG